MELLHAMNTQRAIRSYSAEPVPDAVLRAVMDAAIHAPSGGNNQGWAFVIVKDAALKEKIGEIYKRGWDASGLESRMDDPDPSRARTYRRAARLARHMAEAPVLVVSCIEHDGSPGTLVRGAHIYPGVQNLMLAARDQGLGSVLTTVHLYFERELKELLGIPDNVDTAALIPLGYPGEGARFGPLNRKPVEEVVYQDRWGSGAF